MTAANDQQGAIGALFSFSAQLYELINGTNPAHCAGIMPGHLVP